MHAFGDLYSVHRIASELAEHSIFCDIILNKNTLLDITIIDDINNTYTIKLIMGENKRCKIVVVDIQGNDIGYTFDAYDVDMVVYIIIGLYRDVVNNKSDKVKRQTIINSMYQMSVY